MKRTIRNCDPWLLIWAGIATAIGIFFAIDTGFPEAVDNGRSFWEKAMLGQILPGILGPIFAIFASRQSSLVWQRYAKVIWIVSFLMLFLPFVPGIGVTMNNAARWFKVWRFQVQPSEFAKVAVILYLASVFADRKPRESKRKVRDWIDKLAYRVVPAIKRVWPAVWVVLAMIPIERGKDLGTALVLGSIGLTLCFLGGASKRYLKVGLVVVLLLGFVMYAKEPYRVQRLMGHYTRWSKENVLGSGYQTTQAEIAFATGNWVGVGPGSGRVKYMIPAASTDFILATVGEEFGIFVSFLVVGVLACLVLRLLQLAQQAQNHFSYLVLMGLATWIGGQTIANVMMASAVVPTVGIPLPFISYGGSSLTALWIALGTAFAVSQPQKEQEAKLAAHRHWRRNRRTRLSGA